MLGSAGAPASGPVLPSRDNAPRDTVPVGDVSFGYWMKGESGDPLAAARARSAKIGPGAEAAVAGASDSSSFECKAGSAPVSRTPSCRPGRRRMSQGAAPIP